MSDMNKISGTENNSINFGIRKQNDVPKTSNGSNQSERDTFVKAQDNKDNDSSSNQTTDDATKRISSGNENLVFKVQKLKFYPEDQEKMDKMSVEDRIAYRRELKKQNRYIVLKDDTTES